MVARMYALKSGHKLVAPKRGQALKVYQKLTQQERPVLAAEFSKLFSAEELHTSQDVYRVVLYYILVFKKEGIVVAYENNTPSEVDTQLELPLI